MVKLKKIKNRMQVNKRMNRELNNKIYVPTET